MDTSRSLSVIIPALNEEQNIAKAVAAATKCLQESRLDYEILVCNDGSTDRTGEILDSLARHDSRVRVFHHAQNKGIGAASREGIRLASKEYVTWFAGDNSIAEKTFMNIIQATGSADLVVAYMSNNHERSFLRRNLSIFLTKVLNTLFHLRLKYYNGPSIYKLSLVRSVKVFADRYDYFLELLIRCLKLGVSYEEIPFANKNDNAANSKAIRFNNLKCMVNTILHLMMDVYVKKNPSGK